MRKPANFQLPNIMINHSPTLITFRAYEFIAEKETANVF